jgi:Holliday junction resolvase RusA-like endonuclease
MTLYPDPIFYHSLSGIPVAQKQTRFACACGRGRCYDPSAKDKALIQLQIKPFAPSSPYIGPVSLLIVFLMPIPKGTSKKKRKLMLERVILPDKKPDEDNLAYLISNALKGIIYDDDRRVCEKHVYKFYSEEPGTIIHVDAMR